MPSTAYQLAPWNSVARPHMDITGGALDLGTYAANLAQVYRKAEGVPEVYATASKFFAATYFTEQLRELLGDVLGVLAGRPGNRVLQLRTPFGGGKTHTLLALLHLARDRSAAGGVAELAGMADPGPVRVAVLSGEELDPLRPFQHPDGTVTRTLWGELGAQLGRYELVAEHDRTGAAPGGDTLRALLGEGPVLVLLDEVLVYVEKAMAVQRGDSTAGRQALLFVQALTEVANNRPRTAMVYSLQASVGEAVGSEALFVELDHLVSRIDAKREPVSGDEVMRVVQRRLFADLGDEQVRAEVARAYAELVGRQLAAQADTETGRRDAVSKAARLEQRILAAYPFHPALLDLMYHRWGGLPSYQRTRGALQFLASVVNGLWGWSDGSALIGPGEVDFSHEATRGTFFSQVGERERYSSVLEADVLSTGSGARAVDRRIGADAPAYERLRVGTRLAGAVMLYSFGSSEQERGVLENELVPATLVPGLDRNIIVAALHDLREEALYLHYTGRRYRFEPTPNLSKLLRDEATKLTPEEVLARVREAVEDRLADLPHACVWPEEPRGVLDRVPAFTLAFLHPAWDRSRLPLTRLVEGEPGSGRSYRNGIGLVLPDAQQFDRARYVARMILAAESLLADRERHGFNADQVAELTEKLATARDDLRVTASRAYDRVAVPARATSGDSPYRVEEIDLRTLLTAGRSLPDRVRSALEHHVFDRVTVDKLMALAGLGPDRPAVRLADLVGWFYQHFDFTKLWDRRAIAAAVAEGVASRRLAYVAAVVTAGEQVTVRDPRLVRIGEPLGASEIDLEGDAAILTPELAASLVEPAQPGSEHPAGQQAGETAAGPEQVGPAPRTPGPTDRITQVALRVRLEGGALFGLHRALTWLRDRSTSIDVDVTVRASSKDPGFLKYQLNNGVLEPLQEGGVDDDDIHLELR